MNVVYDEAVEYLRTLMPKCTDENFIRTIAEQLMRGEGVTLAVDGAEERIVASVTQPSAQEMKGFVHDQFTRVGHDTIPYDMLVGERTTKVCDIGPWIWPKADNGAWDGPADELPGLLNIILKHAKKRGVIVQAGGCCGMYPRIFANYFAQVYTFEPDPLNFYCLVRNCQADNISKFQAALGSNHDLLWVKRDGISNVGMHRVSPYPDDKRMLVQQLTIDALVLVECDAIVLDAEAFEPEILDGAIETIRTYRPVISIEMQRVDAVTKIMKTHNYVSVDRNGADSIWIPEEHATA